MSDAKYAFDYVIGTVKSAFEAEPEKYSSFIEIMMGVNRAGKSKTHDALAAGIENLKDLFKGYPNLIAGLNTFLPLTLQIDAEIDNDHDIEPVIESVNELILRFKKRPRVYKQFLDLLNVYRKGHKDEGSVCREVFELLDGYPDLQEGFARFMPDSYRRSRMEEEGRKCGEDAVKRLQNQGLMFCDKVKRKLDNPGSYLAFLKILHDHSTGLISGVELRMRVSDLIGNCPILLDELSTFLQSCEDAAKRQRRGDKVMEGESICEMNLLKYNSDGMNPSYWLLPKNNRKRKDYEDRDVLNGRYICLPSASGETSSRDHSKNKRQKTMNEWEDMKFELDMLIEAAKSAAMRAEEELSAMCAEEESNGTCMRRLRFSDYNLRCIERIYGEEGPSVIQMLFEDPRQNLPVVLKRLRQKEEEWTTFLKEKESDRINSSESGCTVP